MSAVALSDETPVDPDDELLVAYIDGELGRDDQTRLENRLLDDEQLRSRLQQLQTGWELLDDLPEPLGSLKLVESTLELVVADIIKAKPSSGSAWSRYRVPITVAAFCLLGVVGSLVIASTIRSRAYQRQLLDLPIVEHLDAYNYGGDLALMRQISADQDWTKMIVASREIGDIQIESIADMAATPVEEREEKLKSLSLEERAALNSRWERFARLDESNRDRLRRTAESVSQQLDSESLLTTMQAYALWRENLSDELVDKIESSDLKQRGEAIREAIEHTQISITRRSSMKLDDETIEWIYFALRQILQRRLVNGDQATVNQSDRNKGRPDSELFTIASIVMGGWRGPGGSGPGQGQGGPGPGSRRGPPGFGRPGGERPSPLQSSELEMIHLVLPDRALDVLDLVADGDPLYEAMTLQTWAQEAVRRKFPRQRRDDSTLLEQYQEMSPGERDTIDLLPPKEFLKQLSR
jgi:hypothetical protein